MEGLSEKLHSKCYFTEITEWNLHKTLDLNSFIQISQILHTKKIVKYRIKIHFGDVLTNIFYHGDVLTNFWGRFDQFGDVLTRGRFDLGTF